MSLLDEIREDRQPLAHVLKKHKGIRTIVEDLYPDRAHFIYELLQNAEDTGARTAKFTLQRSGLTFEHDGRPFNEADIWAITDIGEGTKADDESKIGRFGVGFKAVFAYSETPTVYSGKYAFEIYDLVLPRLAPPTGRLDARLTRFVFPFNSKKKSPADAFAETQRGLDELGPTTLLFLSNIHTITWQIEARDNAEISRVQRGPDQLEIRKKRGGKTLESAQFLRFSEPVKDLSKQSVAVAFELEGHAPSPGNKKASAAAERLRIVPAAHGCVSVFFPAEKETSGLRFHLHAPFVPELSRASIKETPANVPLFEQLGQVAAKALHRIRAAGLLNGEFLAVLPNSEDDLPTRYEPIRTAIIHELKTQPLTPTHRKGHAPANHLYQAKAGLKELLQAQDLAFLAQPASGKCDWAIGASQKNSKQDLMLESLGLNAWDVDDFVDALVRGLGDTDRWNGDANKWETGPDLATVTWISKRSVEWHQQLYAFLYSELFSGPVYLRGRGAGELKRARIVRLKSGEHVVGTDAFFEPERGLVDEHLGLRHVDPRTYSSGKSKSEQQQARSLLEEIGVRQIGEAEQVEGILRQRYVEGADEFEDENEYWRDLERFIVLVENDLETAEVFAGYWIFRRDDDTWGSADTVYLDEPFERTDLAYFYGPLGEESPKRPLWSGYRSSPVEMSRIKNFAIAVGVQRSLSIGTVSCTGNPAALELVWQAPGRWTNYGVNTDYAVEHLQELFASPTEGLARLVWRTLTEQATPYWVVAEYRNNASWAARTRPSQLACLLRDTAWLPQTTGGFVRPSEAVASLLPKGFPFDRGYPWLKDLRFGENADKQSEEKERRRKTATDLGFSDDESLERAQEFSQLPADEQLRVLGEARARLQAALPQRGPANPVRRSERVASAALSAPERQFEHRLRSVAVGASEVKSSAEEYLRDQYTIDGTTICQICGSALPFKLPNGAFYFEKVEFVPGLAKKHYQNYVALCPNHSAMFEYANESAEELSAAVLACSGEAIQLVLAGQALGLYFTRTHLADLRSVLSAEGRQNEPEKPAGPVSA